MTNSPNFLIYGATGYTGQLIIRRAIHKGLKPILGGRNEEKLQVLAKKYELDYFVADINRKDQLSDLVLLADVILNCAGPFIHTYEAILKACLKNKTHYVDITGEIDVFEGIAAMDEEIKEAGVMAMPGAGFDVVPTDCLAAYLKSQLPTATHLELAFISVGGGVSHGTAKTMVESMDKGGAVRVNGFIEQVPFAHKSKKLKIKKKEYLVAAIPWGDVSTAYHSTGIKNIEVFTGVTPGMLRGMRLGNSMGWLFKRNFMKSFLKKTIDTRPAGPSDNQRKKAKSIVWGKVTDEAGNEREALLTTPEGYTLTAIAAVDIVEKILAGNAPIGFMTPSKAYGADLVLEVSGTVREDLFNNRNIEIT